VEEEHDDADWVALEPTPPATQVEPTSTTMDDGPDPTPSTTWEASSSRELKLLLRLEELKLLLRGRPLPQGRLHSIFSVVTHLNR
jgi:hypothetical protein